VPQIQNWLLKSIYTSKILLSDRKDRLIDLITFNTNHKITVIAEVSENHANIVVNQALENSTDSFGVNAFIEGNTHWAMKTFYQCENDSLISPTVLFDAFN
jgi:hypothetical protein